MYILLALAATALTSWLPICTKLLVRVARPALVAWAINAASLPLLAAGTLLLTGGALPRVDGVWALALLLAAALNGAATLCSTYALAHADAALVTPLLTFNPAFTLLVAALVLGERPNAHQLLGVAVILLGAALLDATGSSRRDLIAPAAPAARRPAGARCQRRLGRDHLAGEDRHPARHPTQWPVRGARQHRAHRAAADPVRAAALGPTHSHHTYPIARAGWAG